MMIPPLLKVRQEIPAPEIKNPSRVLQKSLKRFEGAIKPGQKVAIATGSRGINHISELIKILADWVKSQGGKPFIVPAMGSHGASTSEGQKQVLAKLGISETFLKCPVLSEIEAQKIGKNRAF